MRLSKKMVTAVAIMGAVAVLAPGSAHAATGGAAVAVVGDGTISPGLSQTGQPQHVEFTGTAAGAAFAIGPVGDAGAVNCAFRGDSAGPIANETSAAGTGNVTGTCTGNGVLGTPVVADCNLDYYRAGGTVVVEGNCTITSGSTSVATSTTAGVFVFVPAPGLPTTAYNLVGVALGAGVN